MRIRSMALGTCLVGGMASSLLGADFYKRDALPWDVLVATGVAKVESELDQLEMTIIISGENYAAVPDISILNVDVKTAHDAVIAKIESEGITREFYKVKAFDPRENEVYSTERQSTGLSLFSKTVTITITLPTQNAKATRLKLAALGSEILKKDSISYETITFDRVDVSVEEKRATELKLSRTLTVTSRINNASYSKPKNAKLELIAKLQSTVAGYDDLEEMIQNHGGTLSQYGVPCVETPNSSQNSGPKRLMCLESCAMSMGVPAQRYEIECDETPVEVKASTNVALQRLDDCKGPFPGVNAETLRAQLKAKIVILESELRAEARAAAGLAIAE